MTPEVGTGQFQLCILSPPPNLAWIEKVKDSDNIWHHILSYHLYSHKSPYDADRSDHVKDGDDPEKDEHPYRSVFHISVYLWY